MTLILKKISQSLKLHIAIGQNNENMFLVQIFENNEEVGTLSFLSNMFQSYCHSKNFSKFCKSLKLTLSAKTVAFVKITCQTFCSYAGLFLFSKATKFDFLLWLLWPTQKDFFSFLAFHLSDQNWKYCGVSINCSTLIKEMRWNAKHIILWLGLTKWHFKGQRSLPNLRHEEFSGLCSVLKCECIYNIAWVTLDTEGRNLAKLQVSHKEVKGRS